MAPSASAPTHSALITGASSGLGRALALALATRAQRSRVPLRLWLTGRNAARLSETAECVTALGADVGTATVDVTEAAGLMDWIMACDAAAPLDMVIANAGRSAGTGSGFESAEQVKVLIDTNIAGTINTVLPAAECMRARRHGRILIVSSLAGRLPFPATPTYSASKAFLRNWGLALRPDLAEAGVHLTVVSPGYIATAMTASNQHRMPFLLTAEQAAEHILRRAESGPAEIAFPLRAVLAVQVLAVLPADLLGRLMMFGPRKHALKD